MIKSFFLNGYWLFTLPFIGYIAYIILIQLKYLDNTNQKLVKRVYYLSNLIWIIMISLVFYNDIISFKIFINSNIENRFLNLICVISVLIVYTVVWDMVFISCHSINKITLKGIEITTQEFDEATKAIESNIEDLKLIERIIFIQNRLFSRMYTFQEKHVSLDAIITYKELIEQYVKFRKNISIDTYIHNEGGLDTLRKDYKLNDILFSSIQYSLANVGICLPANDGETDRLYAIIETEFIFDNIIIVIKGKRIMKTEHLVIQNLISHLDSIIESEGNKAIMEAMDRAFEI